MHETGCLGLVHWDDPEGWDGEGGWGEKVKLILKPPKSICLHGLRLPSSENQGLGISN